MATAVAKRHSEIFLLNEHRTKPNVGLVGINEENTVEIDISRVYTSKFSKVTQIPIFNEFDNFKQYNNEAIQPYNLYVVSNYNHALVAQSRI